MNPIPYPASYWVVPGKLLAGQYPGSMELAAAKVRLRALAECGVQRVINLMLAGETDYQGQAFVPYQEALAAIGRERGQTIICVRYPIRDFGVPQHAQMVQILDEIDRSLEANQTVYLHCWGGVGRTGVVVGCYLARHGLAPGGDPLRALAELRREVRPWRESPETEEQRAMVRAWRLSE